MADEERVIAVIPKTWSGLDEWIIYFTTHRVIITRFMAWGSAFGGIFGMALDHKKRNQMTGQDPNELLAKDKKAFEIHYQDITHLVFKRGFGGTITFHISNGSPRSYKMDSTNTWDETLRQLHPILGQRLFVQ